MSKKKKDTWGENGFEDWGGYMAAKQAKLEEQFRNEANTEHADASNIFKGIAIFVNGYTDPSADEIRRIMMAHGGIYHHYMRPRVTTHVIATNLPYSKIMLYRKSQNQMPICKPEWIVDSVNAGRLLNYQNYLLYSNCTETQPRLTYKVQPSDKEKRDDELNALKNNRNENENVAETVQVANANQDSSNLSAPLSSRDALCSKNSDFISEFYSHSRLHHIATMGATFKEYVNELRDKSNGKFPGLVRLKELRDLKFCRSLSDSQSSFNHTVDPREENKLEINQGPIIMHIDMDCFFVSVGIRDKAELKGLPVAVTHAKGKKPVNSNANGNEELGSLSEIASCSYEARKAGVKNGMFLGEALKICPDLKTISYDFDGYEEVSYTLYDTVATYTLAIEAVSCDELYADCRKICEESCLTPMEFASVIRQEIKEKTGCPVSTGFGRNKLLARLATKKAKPDGQFYIKEEQIESCINSFNVEDLPGVGWTTRHKLNSMNVYTCEKLQTISFGTLQKDFGKKMGETLYNMCRGIDNSKLNFDHIRKSVSAEVNYGIRFESNEEALDFLRKLSEEVSNRLKKANAKGRCITLKLLFRAKEAPKDTAKFMGHGLCDYITKSKNLIAPINDVTIISKEVTVLWNQMQKAPEDARGIGIQITRLEIFKSKSRDISLTSFVNKNKKKQNFLLASDRIREGNNENDTESLANSNSGVSGIPSSINQSILRELPEDVLVSAGNSNEQQAGSTSVPKNDEKKSGKHVQMCQENFFKQIKPGVCRPTKVEMPALQEIDMAVLIELPEDIRNEILNEYSAEKNRDKRNVNSEEIGSDTSGAIAARTEGKSFENISFSQVDPEFLAALSEDLRRDVQVYCTAKKAEVEKSQLKKKDETVRNGGGATSLSKQSKKIENNGKSKNSSKNTKATWSKSCKKKCGSEKKSDDPISKFLMAARSEKIEFANDRITIDEAILSHNRTISEDNKNVSHHPHQNMLLDLVNRLLNLPLAQVKMQIQIWITNTKTVNEVDFLSLATFLSMLPEKKRIEDLHVLLKTMHRCMTKTGNCIWHKTYRKTVKYVQHYMQIEYNSNLMVPPIKCNLLQCNSDV